jgi:hypothetical protein
MVVKFLRDADLTKNMPESTPPLTGPHFGRVVSSPVFESPTNGLVEEDRISMQDWLSMSSLKTVKLFRPGQRRILQATITLKLVNLDSPWDTGLGANRSLTERHTDDSLVQQIGQSDRRSDATNCCQASAPDDVLERLLS